MSWLLLWLMVGGASGYVADKIEERYGPARDKHSRRKEKLMSLAIGAVFGPIAVVAVPATFFGAVHRRELTEGPSGKDGLPACLWLRTAIKEEIGKVDQDMEKRQALLGGVLELLEHDFSRQAAQRAGIKPDSGEMPSPARTEKACREWIELKHRREDLEHGLAMTEARIADLIAVYEGQLEAAAIPRSLLRANRRLMRPHEAPPEPMPALPPPAPKQDSEARRAELLAKLGRPCPDQLKRILDNPKSSLDAFGGWRVFNLVGLIDGPPTTTQLKKYREETRAWIAEWVLRHYGDLRLSLAIAETETPKEMAELVRFRLDQALETE